MSGLPLLNDDEALGLGRLASPNAFEVLGFVPRFAISDSELERRQRELFVARSSEGPTALEAVNDACRTLADPVARAELLFCLSGWTTRALAEPHFLEQVFEEREAIERARARKDSAFLKDWHARAQKIRKALLDELAKVIDDPVDLKEAERRASSALLVLRFCVRTIAAAEAALDALDEAEL